MLTVVSFAVALGLFIGILIPFVPLVAPNLRARIVRWFVATDPDAEPLVRPQSRRRVVRAQPSRWTPQDAYDGFDMLHKLEMSGRPMLAEWRTKQ